VCHSKRRNDGQTLRRRRELAHPHRLVPTLMMLSQILRRGVAEALVDRSDTLREPQGRRGQEIALLGSLSRYGRISSVLLDQTITSATSFATGIVIARACSPHEFGLYILGLTLVTLLLVVQEAAIANPYTVYGPRMKGRLPAYAGSVFLHQSVLSWLAILGLTLAAGAGISGMGPEGLSRVLLALIIALPFILLKELIRRLCFADLNHGTALLIDTVAAVLQIGGILLMAAWGVLSPALAFVAWGIACAASIAIWATRSWRSVTLRYRRALPDFARNWRLARWTLPSSLIWAISEYLYPWLLAGLRDAVEVAVFGACFGVASVTNVLLFGSSNYIGPRIMHAFASGGTAALRRYIWRAAAVQVAAIAALAVMLGMFGGTLVAWIYGSAYAGNGPIVAILLTSTVFGALGYAPSRALFAIGRADIDLAVNAVTLIVFLTVGVWLVWSFGPLGAALGLLLRSLMGAAFRVVAVSRLVPKQA
jgi:O-antigen/teichoic acid export membrane protein